MSDDTKTAGVTVVGPFSEAKLWSYLDREQTIRIATTNEDGSLYLSPLWYVVDDQRIFLSVDAGGRHGKNAEAGRPLAALVDRGDEYATVNGVRILGQMVSVDDEEHQARLQEALVDKVFHADHPYAEQFVEFGEFAGRTFFELVPDKIIGWDMRETTMPQIPESRVLPEHVGDRVLG